MGNVQFHSESSAHRFGGTPEDYIYGNISR